MNILYVGSGLSALQAKTGKYKDHTTVALNNAWRIFENSLCDYWIHPDDFPAENFPAAKIYRNEITHSIYNDTIQKNSEKFGFAGLQGYPLECHIGYTSFFQGLYWIMGNFSPKKIGLLGFDHDYNEEKLRKWEADNKPTIQNSFNNKKEATIKEWGENYFSGYQYDSFYGHGTPDPLRFGPEYIKAKMIIAQQVSASLGITIINYSDRPSSLNIFPRETL